MADDAPKSLSQLDWTKISDREFGSVFGQHALEQRQLDRRVEEETRTKGRPVHLGGGDWYREKENGELVYDAELSAPAIRARQEREAKEAADAEAKAAEARRNEPSAEDRRFAGVLDAFRNGGGINGVLRHAGQNPQEVIARESGFGYHGPQSNSPVEPAPKTPAPTELVMSNIGSRYRIESDGSLTLTHPGKHFHFYPHSRVAAADAEQLLENFLEPEQLKAHRHAMKSAKR